ncbi:MAG TPA: ankyrin repeat domain-containing protein [Hyphomonadaceae bacterium]|jgi:hypothetical protein|nr:ankyrin repeat domain-containing protein [Hyphomonadaceae bacterium]
MFGKKKDKLPKDFEAQLGSLSLDELKALFDKYDVNAHGGYSKQTAIAYSECPDDLTRWLVEQGADLSAVDTHGYTPLHSRARHWKGRAQVLLDLGADVDHGDGSVGTPLHAAADSFKPAAARALIAHGARVDALNDAGDTPLERALQICQNMNIAHAAELADMLLAAGAKRTPKMQDYVAKIGTEFEFHRSNFDPETLDAADAGLKKLYALFGVAPVPPRLTYDGKSPIVAPAGKWEDQHQALWELLVPSSGAAPTVQGEVIRASGRIHFELYHNGGVNWDPHYREMAQAFPAYLASGVPLAPALLDEVRKLVASLKRDGEASRLCELAVAWVALNPNPIHLPKPAYDR